MACNCCRTGWRMNSDAKRGGIGPRIGRALVAILLLFLAFIGGALAERDEVFPIPQIKQANLALNRLFNDGEDALYVDRTATRRAAADIGLTGHAQTIMVGDSLTEQGRWDEMFPGIIIHNRGVGGDTIAGLRNRLPQIIAKRPEKVFLLIGINDVFAGSKEADFLRAYAEVLAVLAEDRAVYVQSIPYCARSRCQGSRNAMVARLNAGLEEIARKQGATWIDLNKALSDGGALKPEMTEDGVHLNARGYQQWRALIAPYIVPAKQAG